MPKLSFILDVAAPPEKVIADMVDFSDRRPDIWPNLSKKLYKAHKVGKNTADVTEGTDTPGGSGVWGREKYEWTHDTVRSTIVDSNIFHPGGTFEMRVEPRGMGSRIFFSSHRQAKTVMAKLIGAFMQLSKGAPIRKSMLQIYGSQN